MPMDSGLRGRSSGCISGRLMVSVIPQICMSGAPNRPCHSSNCCAVMFCAYEIVRSCVCRSRLLRGWSSSMRIGAAKSAASVASWRMACSTKRVALKRSMRATLPPASNMGRKAWSCAPAWKSGSTMRWRSVGSTRMAFDITSPP
jgi:hypothetical protein